MIYNVPVIELEDGELGFELPDAILEELQLQPGDTILWTEQEDGSWLLTKET